MSGRSVDRLNLGKPGKGARCDRGGHGENRTLYIFVEYSGLDEADLFQVVLCQEVEIVSGSGFQLGVPHSDLLGAIVFKNVGRQVREIWSRNPSSVAGAELCVRSKRILQIHAGKNVYVKIISIHRGGRNIGAVCVKGHVVASEL